MENPGSGLPRRPSALMDLALSEALAAVRAAHGDRWPYIGPNVEFEELAGWRATRVTEGGLLHHIVGRSLTQLANGLDEEREQARQQPPPTT
jgi:hypothetical protein